MLNLVVVALLQSSAALPSPQVAPTPAPVEKPTCRSEVPTGSMLLGKKVCHTKHEWSQIDAMNAARNERTRRGAPASSNPG